MNRLYKAFVKKVFAEDDDEFDEEDYAKVAKAMEVLADGSAETLANGSSDTLSKAVVIEEVKATYGELKAEIVEAFYELVGDKELSVEIFKAIGEEAVLLNTNYGLLDTHLILQSEKGLFWELPYTVSESEIEFGQPVQLEAVFNRKAVEEVAKKKITKVKIA